MNPATSIDEAQAIIVEEFFPHVPQIVWKVLTSGELMARWLMPPEGFVPVKGNRFTFRTTPAGAWDGVIHCEVLEIVANKRFVYSWQGGHEGNRGYGSRLNTRVTWTLEDADGGTRLRLVHSGFALPENETALTNMGEGWKKVVSRLHSTTGEAEV